MKHVYSLTQTCDSATGPGVLTEMCFLSRFKDNVTPAIRASIIRLKTIVWVCVWCCVCVGVGGSCVCVCACLCVCGCVSFCVCVEHSRMLPSCCIAAMSTCAYVCVCVCVCEM